jgi:hypothetical protein
VKIFGLVPAAHGPGRQVCRSIELDHPEPLGVTVVLMEGDGYRISLTEAFAR